MRRSMLVALTATVLVVAGPGPPAIAGPPAPGPPAAASTPSGQTAVDVLRVWAPEYMAKPNPPMDQQKAEDQARLFDIIFAKAQTYAPYVAAMKQANPSLLLLGYTNALMVPPEDADTYPPDWYLYDADGNKVQSLRYHRYLMNPAVDGWIHTVAGQCQQVGPANGYDGCELDVLGPAPLSTTFVTAVPINPGTGLPFTLQEWLDGTTHLASSVRAAVAPAVVYGNGISDGVAYFNPAGPTSELFDALDGMMAEGFLRVGRTPLEPYPTRAIWKQNVDMLADAGARGRQLLTVTKVWSTGTQQEKDAWHKFALASFLLGADPGGRQRLFFTYDESSEPAGSFHPWWETRLGSPKGPYFKKHNGVFQRNFVSGRVFVNPGTTTKHVHLPGTYTTVDGYQVTEITLLPHTAEIVIGPSG